MRIKDLKTEAKERFSFNRFPAMLMYGVAYTVALNIALLTTLLCLVSKYAIWYGVVLVLIYLIMLAPFSYGSVGLYLKMYRYEKTDSSQIFDGFGKRNLERGIALYIIKFALWLAFTILLIVPGIVFACRTCMATYLSRANPKLKAKDALKTSSAVMKRHCGKYFLMMLSFLGWFLLGIITCGLAFIWVMPYLNCVKVTFYKRELQGDKAVYTRPLPQPAAAPAAAPQPAAVAPAEVPAQSEGVAGEVEEYSVPPAEETAVPDEHEQADDIVIIGEPAENTEDTPPPDAIPSSGEPAPERVYTKPVTIEYMAENAAKADSVVPPQERHARYESDQRDSARTHTRQSEMPRSASEQPRRAAEDVSERRRPSERRAVSESERRTISETRRQPQEPRTPRGTEQNVAGVTRQAQNGHSAPPANESVKERLERLRAERSAAKKD